MSIRNYCIEGLSNEEVYDAVRGLTIGDLGRQGFNYKGRSVTGEILISVDSTFTPIREDVSILVRDLGNHQRGIYPISVNVSRESVHSVVQRRLRSLLERNLIEWGTEE